jgi:hypothetical protein
MKGMLWLTPGPIDTYNGASFSQFVDYVLFTELRDEGATMQAYIDGIVIRVMEKCPEVLCVQTPWV